MERKVKHGVENVENEEAVTFRPENGPELVIITREEYDRLKMEAGKPHPGSTVGPQPEAGKPHPG